MGCGISRFQIQGDKPVRQNNKPTFIIGIKNRTLKRFYETKEIGIQTSSNNLYDKQDYEKPPTPKQVRTEGISIHPIKQINNPAIRRNTMRTKSFLILQKKDESSRVLKKKSSFFHQKDNDQNRSNDSDIFSFDNNNGGKPGQLEKSDQLQAKQQNSNNSQDFDSPFGQQRNNDSENKIDIQNLNSNNNSIQNSVGKDHLNSPSLANQTANFFKNGENDNYSSRDYNHSSPQIFSNNIIPETANKNIIERQNNRTPTLTKPSSQINPTFSNDYILVGGINTEQSINGLGGNGMNQNNQYGRQLSQISEEKEMSLLTNHLRRTTQKKSSIKVDNDSNSSQTDNNVVLGNTTTRGSANVTNADQTSPQHFQGLNGTIITALANYNNNNAFNSQVQKETVPSGNPNSLVNSNKTTNTNEQQNAIILNENFSNQNSSSNNQKINNFNKEEQDQNEEKVKQPSSQEFTTSQQKSNGSFRIKKALNQKSVSVHISPNEIIDKTYQKQSSLHKKEIVLMSSQRQVNLNPQSQEFALSEQKGNLLKQSREEHQNMIIGNVTSPKKQSTMNFVQNVANKGSINLIDFVKSQQFSQKEAFKNNQQSIYNHFRQQKQLSKYDQDKLSNINLQDDPSNLLPLGLKSIRKLSRINPRISQNHNKFVSPKTNLIEFVQQMQYKSQRNSANTTQSPFQFQFQPQIYDQNQEIDGLSPISSNQNPNFRCEYEYDVEDEEVARQMENEKSHNNIASMTNFQNLNNSSSYEEQRGNYSPYSKEQSQSVFPSVINGSEICDNSRIDFERYEIVIEDAQYRGQNNLISSKQQHSQILNSQLFSQQNVILPSSIMNSQSVYQNSKTQPSNKQLPSQSGIHSQVIGSMNSLKVNSPQLTGLIYQNIPSLQKRSISAAPSQSHIQLPNQQQMQNNNNNNPQFKKVLSEFDSSPITQNGSSNKYPQKRISQKDSISPKTDGKQMLNFTQSAYTQNQPQTSIKGQNLGRSQNQNQEEASSQHLTKSQNEKQSNQYINQGQIQSSQNSVQSNLQMQQIQQQQQYFQYQQQYDNHQKLQSQNSNMVMQQPQMNNQTPIQLRKSSSSSRRSNKSPHLTNKESENKNNLISNTNDSKSSTNQSRGNGNFNSSDKNGVTLMKSQENRRQGSLNSSNQSKTSSNHLSLDYAIDKKIIRNSNRKTTMEIKEFIRKRSDSSQSQKSNDSVLTNQENIKEKTPITASQFSKLYKDSNKNIAKEKPQKSQSGENQEKDKKNIKKQQENIVENQINKNKSEFSSNNKVSNNEDSNKNSNKSVTNSNEIQKLPTSKSNSISSTQFTPQNNSINLLQLAKESAQANQRGEQMDKQLSSVEQQQQQYQQQMQQKILNNKKVNLLALQNPNLLNSLQNISEEPNEQYTDMQSKSNFDFPSSVNGRSIQLDQAYTNSNYKPTQNLLISNFSVQTQKDLNQKASIEQYPQNQKYQNSITQPSVSILVENNSSKNVQSQNNIIPNQIVKNTSNYAKEQQISATAVQQKVVQNSQQITDKNEFKKGQKNQNLLNFFPNSNTEQKILSNNINTDKQNKEQYDKRKEQVTVSQSNNNIEKTPQSNNSNKINIIQEPLKVNQASNTPKQAQKEKEENQSNLISNILKSVENTSKEASTTNTSGTNQGKQQKEEQTSSNNRISQIIQREQKRENSQKKIQEITQQPTIQKSRMNYSQTPSNISQMALRLSTNNLSVNSTVLGSSQHQAPSQQLNQSKRDKYQKLSKANTTNISKNLSYSMLQEQHSVLETSKLDKSVNADGQKQINNYIILKNIGHGAFGKVKQVFDAHNKKHYAVKIINRDKLKKKKLDRNKSAFSLIEKEIAICKKMAHPNIVKLYEYIDDQDEAKIYMIMDLLKKGSINSKSYWKIEKGKEYKETEQYKMTEQKLKKYFRDFLLGLDYLHTFVNVVHRDIKPDNLLIGDEDQLKIADFGVSQMFEGEKDEQNNDNGTKCYLAPEAFISNEFSGRPLDIWAAGVSFYEIFTGNRPFNGKTLEVLKKSILETEPNYPNDMSPEFVNMLKKCLNKDPKKRANVQDLIVDDWVTDKGQNPLEFPKYEGNFHDIKDEDIKNAITKSFLNQRVNIQAKLKEKVNITRSNIQKKKSFQVDEDANNNTLHVNKL